jgi:hypothetical protein
MEAASTSETSVNYQTTRCSDSEDSHLHIRCREKPQMPRIRPYFWSDWKFWIIYTYVNEYYWVIKSWRERWAEHVGIESSKNLQIVDRSNTEVADWSIAWGRPMMFVRVVEQLWVVWGKCLMMSGPPSAMWTGSKILASRPALGPVKRPGREVDHSPQSSAEVRNSLTCHPIVKHQGQLYFYIYLQQMRSRRQKRKENDEK